MGYHVQRAPRCFKEDGHQEGRRTKKLTLETKLEKERGNLKSQVKNRVQERQDLWEVWTASHADASRICKGKAEGRAEGSSTYYSLEDPEIDPPHMQQEAPVWCRRRLELEVNASCLGPQASLRAFSLSQYVTFL